MYWPSHEIGVPELLAQRNRASRVSELGARIAPGASNASLGQPQLSVLDSLGLALEQAGRPSEPTGRHGDVPTDRERVEQP